MSFERLNVRRRSADPSVLHDQRLVFAATPASLRSPGLSPTKAIWTQGSTSVGVIV